ncbi:hypothetical protein GI582_09750 [Sulfitobacter sp. BDSS02]|nr:hypothetical protein [Sulfitobacter sp. BDSS02]MBR9849744.1 hypothetical protein [Paracoccaceae bacterium]
MTGTFPPLESADWHNLRAVALSAFESPAKNAEIWAASCYVLQRKSE